jgi:hypothetical protein
MQPECESCNSLGAFGQELSKNSAFEDFSVHDLHEIANAPISAPRWRFPARVVQE